ncbi:hypothetical protein ACFPPF_21965 [Xenophilus aerolatus]|nr:hypothetical protein [Xenophilus aerolatus]
MSVFGKGLSIGNFRDRLGDAKSKAAEAAGTLMDAAAGASAAAFEIGKEYGGKAIEAGRSASDRTTDKAKEIVGDASDAVRNFDFETSKERASDLIARGVEKMGDYLKRTLEVDRTTMEVIQELRSRLPTPVSTVDEIFDQCRDEAIRRAVAAFMLGSVLNGIDDRSLLKYDKLSDSWKDFRTADSNKAIVGRDHANYKAMSDAIAFEGTKVVNGYNRDEVLTKNGANIHVDHVTSRNELFTDPLLSIGLTNSELGDVMNDKRNLVYAERKTNNQKSDLDLWDWVEKHKDDYQPNDDKIVITIQKTGEKRELDKRDLEEAYERSKEVETEARRDAAIEVASTVAKTGAVMAVQQVVGLILVETLDVFMEEIKTFKLLSEDGLVSDLKERAERIRARLNKRFEERRIWARARELGVEAGVAGALSVLPQIVISLFVKMPAFVYAIIRESTLSVARSVRVLCSNDDGKLDSLKVIMFGTASAIAGVYVQRVINTAISGVPLLQKFDSQISSILSGMIVMAIPLVAIYLFDQNKQKIMFRIRGVPSDGSPDEPSALQPAPGF